MNFVHPEFLAIAAALISVPIIIHLINRLRFKRLRWAAMEFLLKAQKRNRRRLIVEQLILLALRCLLVGLVGFLVLRFVGFDVIGGGTSRQSVHVVLLDDTLSMNDRWPDADGKVKDSFRYATKDWIVDKIAKAVRTAGSKDAVLVVPLSRVNDPNFQPKPYDKLNDEARFEELKKDLELLEPSLVHVDMERGVKKVREYIQNHPESQVTLHVLSDFRQKDWGQAEGEPLHKELVAFAKAHKAKVLLLDCAHPYRDTRQSTVPLAHDNIGIVDLRAGTRIVGKDMPVNFTITIANYSAREAEVHVAIFDDKGGEQFQVTQEFNPPLPLKIPAGSSVQASFDYRFTPDLKPGEPYFAQIAAHLESAQRGKLENDGLEQDNVRYASVEVRDQVPILVIDGEAKAGREDERTGKDSFFLQTALVSVPGASYRVEFGDLLGGTAGVPTKALERPDLRNFPTIFMLNVRDLTPKQLANLETFVKEGGGVGFFLGPQVSVPYYNKNLFKAGQGLFPTALKEPYYPPPNQDALSPEFTGAPMLLLRDDLFPSLAGYPIFGQVFKEASHRDVLLDLPVKRYFQVAQAPWRSGKGQVAELATLPNDLLATAYQGAVLKLIDGDLERLRVDAEVTKYSVGLERHRQAIKNVIKPTSEKKGYDLALVLDDMLKDKGREKDLKNYPNLSEFWADSDPKIRSLRRDLEELRDQVRFGDPFVLAHPYGKGKVIAVTTTAGKLWNEWGGGSRATTVYQPFIWEMQNYLSSQPEGTNLTVGTEVEINVDSEPFKQAGKRVRMERSFQQIEKGKKADPIKESDQFGVDREGLFTFEYDQNLKPGLYVAYLYTDDSDKKFGSWGQVFNVDTPREGPLQRVAYKDLKTNVLDKAEGGIRFEGSTVAGEEIVSRQKDMSESPLFFLLFLAVLVAEQALAVHLSFHLRGSEGETLSQVMQPRQAA